MFTKCNSVVDRNNNFFDFSVGKPYQTIKISHYLTAKYNSNNDNDNNNNTIIIIIIIIIINTVLATIHQVAQKGRKEQAIISTINTLNLILIVTVRK